MQGERAGSRLLILLSCALCVGACVRIDGQDNGGQSNTQIEVHSKNDFFPLKAILSHDVCVFLFTGCDSERGSTGKGSHLPQPLSLVDYLKKTNPPQCESDVHLPPSEGIVPCFLERRTGNVFNQRKREHTIVHKSQRKRK